jgi:hypothetical protein
MNDSPDLVQAVADRLRAAVEGLRSEDETDLSRCERHLKAALDALTELLEPVPLPGGAGKAPVAATIGLDSPKVRAIHGKVAFAYQRAHRLERPSVTVLFEALSQWPPVLKKE